MLSSVNNQNQNISFGINIVFRNHSGYQKIIGGFQNHAVNSFVADATVKADSAFTRGIKVCSAGGIVTKDLNGENKKVVMFHINPFDAKNFDFAKIAETIRKNIAGDIPVEGFLVGCQKGVEASEQMFDNLGKFLESLNIPVSKLKGASAGPEFVDIAYDASKDELSVFSSKAGMFGKNLKASNIPQVVNEVKLAPEDLLSVDILA